MKKILVIILILISVVGFSQDTILLNDGRKFEGKIVAQSDSLITIISHDVPFTFDVDNVDTITNAPLRYVKKKGYSLSTSISSIGMESLPVLFYGYQTQFSLDVVNGYQFNEKITLGLGVSFIIPSSYYNDRYATRPIKIPVYGQLKFRPMKGPVSMLLVGEYGYMFYAIKKESEDDFGNKHTYKPGGTFTFAIGLDFALSKKKHRNFFFLTGVGSYKQKITSTYITYNGNIEEHNINRNITYLFIRLGINI